MKQRILLTAAAFLVLFSSCSKKSTPTSPAAPADNTLKAMVLIKAKDSTFQMGSNKDTYAQPVHAVSFSYDFWMDVTEVTQKDFTTLMVATYSGYSSPLWTTTSGYGDNVPAYCITWHSAVLYCNARSKRDGLDTVYSYDSLSGTPGVVCHLIGITYDLSKSGYRLPTEAEWEYACRAGTQTDYYWGNDTGSTGLYAWYTGNSQQMAHDVAQKLPNAFGLYDMSGNLFEWCNDWHDTTYYAVSAPIDPQGPGTGTKRVLRGAARNYYSTALTSYLRARYDPDFPGMVSTFGFRCARRQ